MITKETKLYCIRNYKIITKFINVNFKKGKIYDVIFSDYDKHTPIHIFDDCLGLLNFHIDSDFNKNEVNKYFVTLKEYRKLKLQEIEK